MEFSLISGGTSGMVLKQLLFASVASLTDYCQQTIEFSVCSWVGSLSELQSVVTLVCTMCRLFSDSLSVSVFEVILEAVTGFTAFHQISMVTCSPPLKPALNWIKG